MALRKVNFSKPAGRGCRSCRLVRLCMWGGPPACEAPGGLRQQQESTPVGTARPPAADTTTDHKLRATRLYRSFLNFAIGEQSGAGERGGVSPLKCCHTSGIQMAY